MSVVLSFSETVFIIFVNIVRFQKDIHTLTLKQRLFSECGKFIVLKIIAITAVSERMSGEIKKTGLILARMEAKASNYEEKEEVI